MSETLYPLMPMNDSPYQFLVRRQETFFVDKLALIVNNAPIFEWNVHYLNLKGKHTFDYAGKSIEIHWHWGLSGQPLSFTMYANGTTVAKYVEQKPHAPMEGLSRYVLNSLGLPTPNRLTDPDAISWSFTSWGLVLGSSIMGFFLGRDIVGGKFDFWSFLPIALIAVFGVTLLGFLIDFARLQWYRSRNKS